MPQKKKETGVKYAKEYKVENAQNYQSTWFDTPDSWGFGNSLTSFDSQSKSVLIGAGNVFRRKGPNEYFPKENFRLNMALFLTTPYLFAGVMVRAHYSLGLPYKFVDAEARSTVEEKYLERRARFLEFKQLFFKTSIHMDVYGNAFWYMRRDGRGSIYDITMIQPERVLIEVNPLGIVESYNVLYPDWKNRGLSNKYYTLDPEDVVHFKLFDLGESPWGFSLVQPILPLLESRMEINKIMPILFKAYAKPYRHFQLTPPPGMPPGEIETTIDNMITSLNEETEPDSDLVTGDAWKINSVSPPGTGNPTVVTEDMDEQAFAVMGIPKYFFKPTGTTDLNISKSDQWFRDQMRWKDDYFKDKLLRHYIIPELDAIFPQSSNLPELEFDDDISVTEAKKETLELFRGGVITQNEMRKDIGLDPLPEPEKEEVKDEMRERNEPNKSAVSKSFQMALERNPNLAGRWQDGEITDRTLVREMAKIGGHIWRKEK